jgi:hypothetical protein
LCKAWEKPACGLSKAQARLAQGLTEQGLGKACAALAAVCGDNLIKFGAVLRQPLFLLQKHHVFLVFAQAKL